MTVHLSVPPVEPVAIQRCVAIFFTLATSPRNGAVSLHASTYLMPGNRQLGESFSWISPTDSGRQLAQIMTASLFNTWLFAAKWKRRDQPMVLFSTPHGQEGAALYAVMQDSAYTGLLHRLRWQDIVMTLAYLRGQPTRDVKPLYESNLLVEQAKTLHPAEARANVFFRMQTGA